MFSAIKAFLSENCLKLNTSKTEFVPFSRYQAEFEPLRLDSEVLIPASFSTKNLGVIFDSKLFLKSHISSVRKSAFYHLTRIQSVKSFIPKFTLETLVYGDITSRVDFCNSLLFQLTVTRMPVLDS